ncbi:MAG: tRNA threonylcarbamoyladenosine dehydratase [Bacilli bacterium]
MEQWKRLELIINKKNILKIQNTAVLVLGLGGVGSYAIESLVRSGIGKIVIVDNDIIDITNLNRQLMAMISNIGMNKVDAFENRIKDINPNCQIIKIREFITKENIDILFNTNINYIVDACDTIETKKELIRKCIKKNIKLISVMGTGNKLNPSKLQIQDIRKTSYDPIAKILRKMINDEQIKEKVMVICSTEVPIVTNCKTIGSTSFVPASAGLLCTSYIINDIVGEINE